MNAVQLNMLVGGFSATPPPSASEEEDWVTAPIPLPGDTIQQVSGPAFSKEIGKNDDATEMDGEFPYVKSIPLLSLFITDSQR